MWKTSPTKSIRSLKEYCAPSPIFIRDSSVYRGRTVDSLRREDPQCRQDIQFPLRLKWKDPSHGNELRVLPQANFVATSLDDECGSIMCVYCKTVTEPAGCIYSILHIPTENLSW